MSEPDEYIPPDSTLARALSHWHGWWRFMWHWSDKNLGFHVGLPRHHVAPFVNCGHWSWSFWIWRFSFCFNCQTIEESRAEKRRIFKSDIWPTLILDDALDAEEIEVR